MIAKEVDFSALKSYEKSSPDILGYLPGSWCSEVAKVVHVVHATKMSIRPHRNTSYYVGIVNESKMQYTYAFYGLDIGLVAYAWTTKGIQSLRVRAVFGSLQSISQ